MKSSIYRLILSTVILVLCLSSIQAQLQVNTYSYSVDEDVISDAKRASIEATTIKSMNLYYEYAGFIDDELGVVTSSSIRKFKDLFQSSSRILNDLTTGVNSHYSDYAGSALDFLQKEGIKFDMQYASILEMEYDEAGYYVVVVQAEKTVYTGLNYSNEPEFCKTGREYALKFRLVIEEDDLDMAKFSKITGSLRRRCEDAKPFVGFGLRGATDLTNNIGTATDFLQNEMTGLIYTPGTIWTAGAGLTYQMPITKKGIYLNIGASYNLVGMSGDIEGAYVKEGDIIVGALINGNGYNEENENTLLKNNKKISIEEGRENITIHTVEIPVGIRYRKSFTTLERLAIVADILFVPNLHIASTADLSVKSVRYDGVVDTDPTANLSTDEFEVLFPHTDANLGIIGFGNVNNDDDATLSATPKLTSQFSFGIRIAPGVQYELAENIFLEVNLDYTLGLSDFLSDETLATGEEGDYFLEDIQDNLNNLKQELNRSFVETYYENTTLNTLGIKVGVAYLFD